jgi:hypothetical protein
MVNAARFARKARQRPLIVAGINCLAQNFDVSKKDIMNININDRV